VSANSLGFDGCDCDVPWAMELVSVVLLLLAVKLLHIRGRRRSRSKVGVANHENSALVHSVPTRLLRVERSQRRRFCERNVKNQKSSRLRERRRGGESKPLEEGSQEHMSGQEQEQEQGAWRIVEDKQRGERHRERPSAAHTLPAAASQTPAVLTEADTLVATNI
jgi:hypothetical protein